MKIAVVAPTHLPARRANTLQVMKMTQAFAALGHEARLAVPGMPVPPVRWESLARQYGLERRFPVEWLPVHPQMRRYDYGCRSVSWARNWGAELLYTRLPQAAALSSFLGMATILEVHDYPQGTLGPFLFRRFVRGSGARRLVAITRALADDLARGLDAPVEPPFTLIASDGVDLARYAEVPSTKAARQGLPLSLSGFVAGYTGHLYPGRGADLILEMAARLPEVTFLLVGGEPGDVSQLKKRVESLGLQNVVLTGFVPNLEISRYQAACDVLLMPYQPRVEASSGGDIARYLSPMKLFEYLASGRAILSSNLPVLQEILNSENALLLPPDQVEVWVAALRDLQAHPERGIALGTAARREARRYTWEARAQKVLEGI